MRKKLIVAKRMNRAKKVLAFLTSAASNATTAEELEQILRPLAEHIHRFASPKDSNPLKTIIALSHLAKEILPANSKLKIQASKLKGKSKASLDAFQKTQKEIIFENIDAILELRERGYSYSKIAKELEIASGTTIHYKAVERAIKAAKKDTK